MYAVLQQKIESFPLTIVVYLRKAANGKIIYVGKAI